MRTDIFFWKVAADLLLCVLYRLKGFWDALWTLVYKYFNEA